MVHSRLGKQSALARSAGLERPTSAAGEMLPDPVTSRFRAGGAWSTTGAEPARSARYDSRSGRPLALTSHRARSDFPSGAAPDRVSRPKRAGGVANKKYVWYSVGLQRAVSTVRLEF